KLEFSSTPVSAFAAWTGGQRRTLRERARDVCHIDDFPSDPTGDNSSASALQSWLTQAETAKAKMVLGRGDYVNDGRGLIVRQSGMIIEGSGGGYGYGSDASALPDYFSRSRIIAADTGPTRVMTRRLYRASGSDPNDPAMSALIDIEAEGVVV